MSWCRRAHFLREASFVLRLSVAPGRGFGVNFKYIFKGLASLRMSKYVALLCLVLTVWSASAFAAHQHSNGAESAKCTVCLAAHTAAPRATAPQLQAAFTPISIVRIVPVSAQERFAAFALSVRPPPAV